MNNNQASERSQRRLYIRLVSILLFAVIMGTLIVYFYQSEPGFKAKLLYQFGNRLQSSATNTHWQWQAEGRPNIVLLVHYNSEGKEIDRSPVTMSTKGWPQFAANDAGCRKLWRLLLNESMELSGFRVFTNYLPDANAAVGVCRYRLSSGENFTYIGSRGEVVYDQ